jgi:Ca-activated chloride channel family protein
LKKSSYLTFLLASGILISYGQQAPNVNGEIRNGNKLYQQKIFDQSAAEYKKAIAVAPENPVANYNLGNAQFRSQQYEEANVSYESTITNSKEKPVREKSFYNRGVAFSKQQKLDESIDAWKNALKLDATDEEARENLQKALVEKKKQQEKQDQKKDKDDKKKDNKDQDKDKNKDKQDQNPDQQSKLTKKQVEQLLKALAQKEKEVQQKMQAKNASPAKLDKDW